MSAFEFVFGLLSVIASLALTHLVSGAVQMLRTGARPSLFLALWMWIAFATTVGNWGGFWDLHGANSFPAWMMLVLLATMIGQYVFCALVIPASRTGREAAAGPARDKERAWFVGAFCALLLLALIVNLSLNVIIGGHRFWSLPTILSLVQILLAGIALFGPWSWSRAGASAIIAVLATVWLVQACQIVASS